MELAVGHTLSGDLATVTETTPVVVEDGVVGLHEEGDQRHCPGPIATHLDIHKGPPPRNQPSTNKINDNMTMDSPDIDQVCSFDRVSGSRRPTSRGRVRVLKHDLEDRNCSLGNREGVVLYAENNTDPLETSTDQQHAFEDGSTTARQAAKPQVIIFPQFAQAVTEEQAAASAFRRARSFTDKGNRSASRDFDIAQTDTGPNSAFRRQVESRRSYAVNTHKTPTQFRPAGKGLVGEEGTSEEGRKFMIGLYPEGTSEYMQAKVAPTSLRRPTPRHSNAPKRPTSPLGTEEDVTQSIIYQKPDGNPPPSPTINGFQGLHPIAIMNDHYDIPDGKENHPPSRAARTREKNGWKSAKRESSDPGVSNTTQMLLETKMRKQTLCFPEISAEEQRRALGTPRYEPPSPLLNRRGSARSPTRSPTRSQKRQPPKDQDGVSDSRERLLPAIDNHSGSHQISVNRSIDATLATADHSNSKRDNKHSDLASEQVTPRTAKTKTKDLSGSILSLNSDCSKKTTTTATTLTNNRDRYSRMIALGLPRVNLDIEKNHFSRQSLKRRSQNLREKYEMRSNDGAASNGPLGHGVIRSEPPPVNEPTEVACNGGPPNASHLGVDEDTDTDVMWPGNGGDVESVVLKSYNQDSQHRSVAHVYMDGMNLPISSSGDPPLTSVPKAHVMDQSANGGFRRQTSVRRSCGKQVNYTYFRMMPPGKVNCTPASTVIESPRTPKVTLYQSAA